MTATTVLPAVLRMPAWTRRSPSWLGQDLVGEHPPCVDSWRCQQCPDRPLWPCPPACDHAAALARTTPHAGRVWLAWCAATATAVLGTDRAVVVVAHLAWYGREVDRVAAYVGNRGRRWRLLHR